MSDLIKNLAIFGASGALLGGGKSGFADAKQDESGGFGIGLLIFIIVVIIVFEILLLVSTYKLTSSGWQTFFCLLFGVVYLVFAYIYYGMAGYKFAKK